MTRIERGWRIGALALLPALAIGPATPFPALAQDRPAAACSATLPDEFRILHFHKTTAALIGADTVRHGIEGLVERAIDEEWKRQLELDLRRQEPTQKTSHATSKKVSPAAASTPSTPAPAPSSVPANLSTAPAGAPSSPTTTTGPGNGAGTPPDATTTSTPGRGVAEDLAHLLRKSTVVPCEDPDLHQSVRQDVDTTALTQQLYLLAIDGDGEKIVHYVLPYRGGQAGQLPFKSCFVDGAMSLDQYRKRLSGHQMAAIGLYEARRVHLEQSWCRLGVARMFLAGAIHRLTPPPSEEDGKLLRELTSSQTALESQLRAQFGTGSPGAEQTLRGCGVSREATRLLIRQVVP
jgi:hypothetical protein